MLLRISEAAIRLGVCIKTLRRWETAGILQPHRTLEGHRRYDPDALLQLQLTGVYTLSPIPKTGYAAIYARVSAAKQQHDLETQRNFLVDAVVHAGFRPKEYCDITSGLNDSRKGLLRLLHDAFLHRF